MYIDRNGFSLSRQVPGRTTLFLVRHGETDYNRRQIIQGRRIDSTLNAHGRRQAAALSRRFEGMRIRAIYSSTLRRAEETARFVGSVHPGVPVVSKAGFAEMSWGIYEGREFTPRVAKAFSRIWAEWNEGDFTGAVPGGESILDVQDRAIRSLRSIMAFHHGESIIVVTHGRFLRVLIASLLPDYGLERMHEIEHANTAVNTIYCVDGTYYCGSLNCTLHLSETPASVMTE